MSATAEDILLVMNGLVPFELENFEFCVITATRREGENWWPFEKGEILVVDKFTGRERWGDGRKPGKWDIDAEYISSLDEAKVIRARVLGADITP